MSQHEFRTSTELTVEEANREHIEAVRQFAAAEKFGPAPVDVNDGVRRTRPFGPVEHGAVREAPFHPSPTLDPRHAELLEGYEEFAEDLAPLRQTLEVAFKGLSDIAAARDQLRQDPSKTEAAAIVLLVGAAERKHEHIVSTFSKTEQRLRNAERALEKSLQAPVVQNAGLGTVNGEIRDHVKKLDAGKRHKLIEEAFAKHDESTLVALLGAAPFLSGLDDAAHALYLKRLHEMRNPEGTRKLKALRAGIALLERAVPIALSSVEKALGSSFARAKELKGVSDASDRALKAIMTVGDA